MTYEEVQKMHEYEAFIASIDNSKAGTDEYGNLAWHVDCSAQANACDTCPDGEGFWEVALDTAKMCADDWKGFYPQL